MALYDFGQEEIRDLKKENARLKLIAEDLVKEAFVIAELRDVWRKKFGLPTKCEPEDE